MFGFFSNQPNSQTQPQQQGSGQFFPFISGPLQMPLVRNFPGRIPFSGSQTQTRMQMTQRFPDVNSVSDQHYCNACDLTFYGAFKYNEHLNGQEHQMRLKSMTDAEQSMFDIQMKIKAEMEKETSEPEKPQEESEIETKGLVRFEKRKKEREQRTKIASERMKNVRPKNAKFKCTICDYVGYSLQLLQTHQHLKGHWPPAKMFEIDPHFPTNPSYTKKTSDPDSSFLAQALNPIGTTDSISTNVTSGSMLLQLKNVLVSQQEEHEEQPMSISPTPRDTDHRTLAQFGSRPDLINLQAPINADGSRNMSTIIQFNCELCNVKTDKPVVLFNHLDNDLHKKNVASTSSEVSEQALIIRCTICQVSLPYTEEVYNRHVNGKNHIYLLEFIKRGLYPGDRTSHERSIVQEQIFRFGLGNQIRCGPCELTIHSPCELMDHQLGHDHWQKLALFGINEQNVPRLRPCETCSFVTESVSELSDHRSLHSERIPTQIPRTPINENDLSDTSSFDVRRPIDEESAELYRVNTRKPDKTDQSDVLDELMDLSRQRRESQQKLSTLLERMVDEKGGKSRDQAELGEQSMNELLDSLVADGGRAWEGGATASTHIPEWDRFILDRSDSQPQPSSCSDSWRKFLRISSPAHPSQNSSYRDKFFGDLLKKYWKTKRGSTDDNPEECSAAKCSRLDAFAESGPPISVTFPVFNLESRTTMPKVKLNVMEKSPDKFYVHLGSGHVRLKEIRDICAKIYNCTMPSGLPLPKAVQAPVDQHLACILIKELDGVRYHRSEVVADLKDGSMILLLVDDGCEMVTVPKSDRLNVRSLPDDSGKLAKCPKLAIPCRLSGFISADIWTNNQAVFDTFKDLVNSAEKCEFLSRDRDGTYEVAITTNSSRSLTDVLIEQGLGYRSLPQSSIDPQHFGLVSYPHLRMSQPSLLPPRYSTFW